MNKAEEIESSRRCVPLHSSHLKHHPADQQSINFRRLEPFLDSRSRNDESTFQTDHDLPHGESRGHGKTPPDLQTGRGLPPLKFNSFAGIATHWIPYSRRPKIL